MNNISTIWVILDYQDFASTLKRDYFSIESFSTDVKLPSDTWVGGSKPLIEQMER